MIVYNHDDLNYGWKINIFFVFVFNWNYFPKFQGQKKEAFLKVLKNCRS